MQVPASLCIPGLSVGSRHTAKNDNYEFGIYSRCSTNFLDGYRSKGGFKIQYSLVKRSTKAADAFNEAIKYNAYLTTIQSMINDILIECLVNVTYVDLHSFLNLDGF